MRKFLIPTLLTLAIGGGGWYGLDTWFEAREAARLAAEQAEEEKRRAREERERQRLAAEQAAARGEVVEVPEEKVLPPRILVAARTLPRGAFIRPGDVEWRDWEDFVELGLHVVEGTVKIAAVTGVVMITEVRIDEPIAWNQFIKPNSPGFIAAALKPGYKALTIEVDKATTRAGIIWPGDRVDVIVTHESEPGAPRAWIVARDVRVIAVGSHVDTLGSHGLPGVLSEGVLETEATAPQGDTYTLEVGRGMPQRLAIAKGLGRMTMVVRGLEEIPGDPSPQPVGLHDVLPHDSESASRRRSVRVIRGKSVEVRDFGPLERVGQ